MPQSSELHSIHRDSLRHFANPSPKGLTRKSPKYTTQLHRGQLSTSTYTVGGLTVLGTPPLNKLSITTDIFDVGAVLTAGCGLLAVLSALYFVFTWFAFGNSSTSLRIQSCTLFFCAVWLFATLVPFDLFFATRQASVSATLDGITVSQSIIQNIEEALGISPVYREQSFLKLVAILPWFAFLFAIIAGLILHVAASRVSAYGGDSEKKPRKFFRANS
ncbi:hypothetical protein ID866_6423 [Astraeus odoratus]|nr:hypothetical protein ID866_6423 [Astraeus odoratus]